MNTLIKNIISSIKPSDSKQQDFNLAVADYLCQGLREKGLECENKNAIVDIKLQNKYLDKYSSVIIDCMDGNLYLRGADCKDKKWGKLRRFEGERTADAFHCATQSITRIYNRIKSLNDQDKEIYAAELCNKTTRLLKKIRSII